VDVLKRVVDRESVLREMAVRRGRQWRATFLAWVASMAGVFVALATVAHVSFLAVLGVTAAFLLPVWFAWFRYARHNWRCPSCDAPLPGSGGTGYMFRAPACPKCGLELR
jgi:Flp pilus assembly protein TadB